MLIIPIVWLSLQIAHSQRLFLLNSGFDIVILLLLLGIGGNIAFAQYPNQAIWQGIPLLGFIAGLYALNQWLQEDHCSEKLFLFQGGLGLAFIIVSLVLWSSQTVIPELAQLQTLNAIGISSSFNLNEIPLRNWHPLGHQNYVAGYLSLVLPVLLSLGLQRSGWQRHVWLTGFILGLVDLYTTYSRAGFLCVGLCSIIFCGTLILQKKYSNRWRLAAIVMLLMTIGITVSNSRVISFIAVFLTNTANSDVYRIITNSTGITMGSAHPWTGLGLGNVPLLYQQFRPFWAGQEAELTFQLHSTPAQIWAEMGLWGLILGIVTIALGIRAVRTAAVLTAKGSDEISRKGQLSNESIKSLWFGLFAYGLYSLTDYQLDNVAISGTLVVYGALILSHWQLQTTVNSVPIKTRAITLGALGWALFITLWLIPVHRAWHLSSQGFLALHQDNLQGMRRYLEKATQLVPWDPYYPNQIAWNLGDHALTGASVEALTDSLAWFQQSLEIAPAQEFVHTNMGWLLVNTEPKAATQSFMASIRLIPAKKGLFFSLGYSLLQQNELALAIQAFTLESLRSPLIVTSPLWQQPPLQMLYPQVLANVETTLTQFIATNQEPTLQSYWQHIRAGILWWRGDSAAAQVDWQAENFTLGNLFGQLDQGNKAQINSLLSDVDPASAAIIHAWLEPDNRPKLLKQALLTQTVSEVYAYDSEIQTNLLQKLQITMQTADTFSAWLKHHAPSQNLRNERLGFGIISRHIDGPIPSDFLPRSENIPMQLFFGSVLQSPAYNKALDIALQPLRNELLDNIDAS
ncbi:O-antigen ligase family protein [Leptothoe spongobia]|uniref:O-antigen ligase family protein n=1 Tax=Leptothoe spongobia TAU-MAC 1115 TaxID=1967444 RepID=A0A947DG03_9CYAN|nr:O-antigen ligase family protein [Leptothoe spongobia]MBT9315231.1 O-antigen ligase family protein [Leptothoe spongobia TAU-MAC 1115]